MPYHLATPGCGGDGGDSNPARWFRCREIFHLTARSGSYIAVLSRLHMWRAFPPADGAFHPFQRFAARWSLFIARRKTMKRLPSGAWSGGRVSNPRPSDWKSDALPAELPPHIMCPLQNCTGAPRIRMRRFYAASGRLSGADRLYNRKEAVERGRRGVGTIARHRPGAPVCLPRAHGRV